MSKHNNIFNRRHDSFVLQHCETKNNRICYSDADLARDGRFLGHVVHLNPLTTRFFSR
jgi:hypothetical protein